MSDLAQLLDRSDVIVACGPGGVGKTTTAAALGVAAARRGRRVVVVPVDPARRLADALGISDLGNEPRLVLPPDGVSWTGSLSALMLDTASTFDALVGSKDPRMHDAEPDAPNEICR